MFTQVCRESLGLLVSKMVKYIHVLLVIELQCYKECLTLICMYNRDGQEGQDTQRVSPWEVQRVDPTTILQSDSTGNNTANSNSTTYSPYVPESISDKGFVLFCICMNAVYESITFAHMFVDLETHALEAVLQKIMDEQVALNFKYAVHIDEYPGYAIVVPMPMDLNTILRRIQTHHYRHIQVCVYVFSSGFNTGIVRIFANRTRSNS